MGMLSTPMTAVTASMITWYSFFQNATRDRDGVGSVGDHELFNLSAFLADVGGQGLLVLDLQAALEERDSRIRELENATGATATPPLLPEWRQPLQSLALFVSTASEADAAFQEGGTQRDDADAAPAPRDALGALLEAHMAIVMLLLDLAQDLEDWAVGQIWSWPVDSRSSLPSIQTPQAGAHFGRGLAEALAKVNASLPAALQGFFQLVYGSLHVALGKLAASVAQRHPQHAATLARDPVLLAAQLTGFVMLACWELYGFGCVLLALLRRFLRALCCFRRRPAAKAVQVQATASKRSAAGRTPSPASPRHQRAAAGGAVAAVLTPPKRSKAFAESEFSLRSPPQACDKENFDENQQHYL